MKERPILFNGPMVRAILDGRKTQTRRVVKNAHIVTCDDKRGATDKQCPFGVPGDRLWVRENFQHTTDARGQGVIVYAADDSAHYLLAEDNGEGDLCGVGAKTDRSRCQPVDKWRPSIHMPRWASRITLEVVSVRVERLADISEEDAKAEGYEDTRDSAGGCFELTIARENFLGAPWAVSVGPNPWVWVVQFRRIER